MTANAAADFGSAALAALARALGLAALVIGAGLALMFAFVAAMVVTVMVAGAALALRFWPRRERAAKHSVLEARPTADGWVVETSRKY